MNTPSAARMKEELVISLRTKMFGDRGTDIQAAFDYVETVINGMDDSHNRGPAWTAVHVLANTIANVIETLPEYVDRIEFLPAPPDEVRISPVDNPAAGVSDLEAAIIRMIDSRIAQSPSVAIKVTEALDETTERFGVMILASEKRTAGRIEEINQQIEGKVTEGIDDFIANQLDDEIQKYMDNSVDFTEIVRDELRQNITFNIEVE
jgi:hypothetical protein